nr:hypothetical protein CFP56_72790 [Quercus suber]
MAELIWSVCGAQCLQGQACDVKRTKVRHSSNCRTDSLLNSLLETITVQWVLGSVYFIVSYTAYSPSHAAGNAEQLLPSV